MFALIIKVSTTALQGCQALYVHPQSSNCGNFYSSASLERICLPICDMEWTGEAIGNIVKNALDHTQAGGIVRITWERTPAMFRIFISDNGNGIVPEDIYHIFKRFYRSKHSLDTQGIGLGLPLAKSIIEGQNGVISVQSEVGKGTLFTLSFLTDL